MARRDHPYTERKFVPGDARTDKADRKRQQAMDAYMRGDRETFARLDAEAEALADPANAVAAHWEKRKTGQTRGERFSALDRDGRRDLIRQKCIVTAERVDDDRRLVYSVVWRELVGL